MTEIQGKTEATLFNIAIVISRFNEEVTQRLHQGALIRLLDRGLSKEQISSIWVPGAVEIPLTAQVLAKSDRFSAIICLGAVIRGETKHFDYVCQQISHGCQHVALEQEIPIIFGVLTTDNEEQAMERCGGRCGHKGIESADAALDMISVLTQIENMSRL